MKKIIKLIFSIILFAGGTFSPAILASAEELTDETQLVKTLAFQDLPSDEKEFFLENGFDEEDTYIMTETKQNLDENTESRMSLHSTNVVTTYASTKRTATNRAQTVCLITSSKLPIISADVRTTATAIGRTLVNTGSSRPGTKSTSVTINTLYNGPKTDFLFKSNAQVTTTAGLVPWIFVKSAGGTTLGW